MGWGAAWSDSGEGDGGFAATFMAGIILGLDPLGVATDVKRYLLVQVAVGQPERVIQALVLQPPRIRRIRSRRSR